MNTTITFHIKKDEKEKIRALAEKLGFNLSGFCRVELLKILRLNEGDSA